MARQPENLRGVSWQKYALRLVYSNAYLAFPILAVTGETYVLSGSFWFDLNYLGFIFFSTLFLYPFHRLFGIKTTARFEQTKAQKEVAQHPALTKTAMVLGVIGVTFFAFRVDINTLSYIFPLGILAITYSVHLIPTPNGWKRLRDIPGIKIFAITSVATLATSTIPLLVIGNISIIDIWFFGIERFLFFLAITIPFDVRDTHLDKRWKLKTIPLLLGNKLAMRLAITLLYAGAVLNLIHYLIQHSFGLEVVAAHFASAGFTHIILYDFTHRNSYLYNAFLVEGSMVYHFAFTTMSIIITDWVF